MWNNYFFVAYLNYIHYNEYIIIKIHYNEYLYYFYFQAEVEEMVKICMVCETVGYKAEFIYVHALKLAQKGNLQQKHTGKIYISSERFIFALIFLVIIFQ